MRAVTQRDQDGVSAVGQNPRLRCARRGSRHLRRRFAHRLASSQLASHDAGMLPQPSRTRHRPKRAESMLTDLLARHSPPTSRSPHRRTDAIARPPRAPGSQQLLAGQNGAVGHHSAMNGRGEHDAAIYFVRAGALADRPADVGWRTCQPTPSIARAGQGAVGNFATVSVEVYCAPGRSECRDQVRPSDRPSHSKDRKTAADLTRTVLPAHSLTDS